MVLVSLPPKTPVVIPIVRNADFISTNSKFGLTLLQTRNHLVIAVIPKTTAREPFNIKRDVLAIWKQISPISYLVSFTASWVCHGVGAPITWHVQRSLFIDSLWPSGEYSGPRYMDCEDGKHAWSWMSAVDDR